MLFQECMKAHVTVSEDGLLSIFMVTDKSEDPIYNADLKTMLKDDVEYDVDKARIPDEVIMRMINGSMDDFSSHFMNSLKKAVRVVEEKSREELKANGKKAGRKTR